MSKNYLFIYSFIFFSLIKYRTSKYFFKKTLKKNERVL